MLIKEGGFPGLNGFGVVEGKFRCDPGNYDSIAVELLVMYLNHPTMQTLGTCKFKGMVLSTDTLDKLGDFLRSAEQDIEAVLKKSRTLAPGATITEFGDGST